MHAFPDSRYKYKSLVYWFLILSAASSNMKMPCLSYGYKPHNKMDNTHYLQNYCVVIMATIYTEVFKII